MPTLQEVDDKIISEIRASTAEPLMYDLGAGQNPQQGFMGLDKFTESERVKRCDLFFEPWAVLTKDVPVFDPNTGTERAVDAFLRIRDESVDYLMSSHFLEHVPDWNMHFREAYRVLKPGAHYKVIAPYYKNDRWFQDPDHKQPILTQRFAYLSQDWLKRMKLEHSPSNAKVNFEIAFYAECFHEDFADKDEESKRYWASHGWNVIEDIALILKKLPMPQEN